MSGAEPDAAYVFADCVFRICGAAGLIQVGESGIVREYWVV
jgi:hypothetical protein